MGAWNQNKQIIKGLVMDKFARMYIKYEYKNKENFISTGNLGDSVQNIAIENLYKKIGTPPCDLLCVNRDELSHYNGEKCKLVMQAYFGYSNGTFPLPWSDKIIPIFLGFHISSGNHGREHFINANVQEKMKPFQPIGCRDRNTRDFLRGFGLDAYFSGCMTLTFDKRESEPENGKIFIVDLNKRTLKHLPKRIRKLGDFSITHVHQFEKYPISESDAEIFENKAREILNRYKNEAKLVITSRIHVAMPCVAMGIPVIFITDYPRNERFDVLRGILPVYSYHDMMWVNWNPTAVDITELKQAIIDNAIAQITGKGAIESRKKLEGITESLKPIPTKPFLIRIFTNLFK